MLLICSLSYLTCANAATPDEIARKNDIDIAKALKDIGTLLDQANKPSQLDRPCDISRPERTSDLCAQWQAADAALESAKWAEREFFLGIASALASIITLVAAVAAAKFARDAAIQTANGAMAARDTLNAQRAWMLLAEVETLFLINARTDTGTIDNGIGFRIKWTNKGLTPALRFGSNLTCSLRYLDGRENTVRLDKPLSDDRRNVVVAQGASVYSFPAVLDDEQARDFRAMKLSVHLIAECAYDDIFVQQTRTTKVYQLAEHRGGHVGSGNRQNSAAYKEAIEFVYETGSYAT